MKLLMICEGLTIPLYFYFPFCALFLLFIFTAFRALHKHCLEIYFDFSIGLFKIAALGITLYIHN